MSIHVHVSHHEVEEIHVYAESPGELEIWVASWMVAHKNQHPRVITIDDLSCICQSRKK